MKFDTLVLDYESYWSNDYSLSRLNTIRYVRDQRFKYHGAALKLNGAPAEWVTGSHLKSVLQNDIDWSKTLLVGHNLPFDGLILAEIDECWPHTYVDTLGMARCVLGGTVPSRSLDAVAQHYGHVGKLEKGGALYATKGVRDLSPEQERTLAAYACQDAEQTALIFRSMWPEFPKKMLATLDWTVRMMTQPGIQLNADVMRECHETEVEIKRNAVANCRLTKTQLNSNKQFADILREHGIEPPTKISRTTGKETYAFSKTDQEFVDLQDDPNTDVRDLVLARLAVKSSIEETRSKAYLELAEDGKLMPVPLAFCGAMQTGRLSGTEGLNCFTGDHELLTPNGWQRIDEWDAGTPVMQWERNGSMSFVLAERKIEKLHDGYCVAIEGRTVSAFVTPEHRFAHVKFKTSADRVAQDLLDGRRIDVPLRGEYAGAGAMTADQARFMVALAADGSKQKRRWSFGFRRDRKIARMRELLSRLGAEYRETDKDAQGTTHFYVDSRTVSFASKGYGAWVLSLDAEAADAALDEVRHWDGFANSNNGATQFCSQFEDQAVWVCTLARLRGISATISSYARPTSTGRMHFVYFGSSKASTLSKANAERVPYAGTVYCLTVPSSYVFVKRGTKMFVTGQCQNLGRQSRIRDGMEAPDGYVFVEADSSNIELRVVAKFCGQDDLVETLRAGGDAYSDFATTLFGVPVTKALTKTDPVIANYRQTGKVSLLSSQYRVGARTFQKMLWVQAGLRIGEDEAERINTLYRKTYTGISGMWTRLDKQLKIMATGAVPPDLDPTHPIIWHSDSIELPSGFKLKYPDLRYVTDQQTGRKSLAFTFFGGKSNGLKYVHGGTLLENCLAGDTEVATLRGWVRLASVRPTDLVWDGVTWVRHSGLVCNGERTVIDVGGVRMTADHRVWVGEWREAREVDHGKAAEAFASSFEGPHWRAVRHEHGGGVCGVSDECGWRFADDVAGPLQLRHRDARPRQRVEKEDELSLSTSGIRHQARHVEASGVLGLAQYARSVPPTDTPGVVQLRSAWHSSMRTLGQVRRLLGRHGANVLAWFGLGPREQRRALRAGELPVGDATAEQSQQEEQHANRSEWGVDEQPGRGSGYGCGAQHADVPMEPRRSRFGLSGGAERKSATVYDIRHAGHNNRFTVRGADGRPFLVHNCGQALAREIIDPQVQKIRRRYPVLLQVHDAVLALVPETEAEEGVAYVRECMSEAPSWWPGIPITCEAGYGKTYGGIKKS